MCHPWTRQHCVHSTHRKARIKQYRLLRCLLNSCIAGGRRATSISVITDSFVPSDMMDECVHAMELEIRLNTRMREIYRVRCACACLHANIKRQFWAHLYKYLYKYIYIYTCICTHIYIYIYACRFNPPWLRLHFGLIALEHRMLVSIGNNFGILNPWASILKQFHGTKIMQFQDFGFVE